MQDHDKKVANERILNLWSWAVVIIITIITLAGSVFLYFAIGTRPRAWYYNTPPSIPAQTYSSTEPAAAPPSTQKQVELPPRQSERKP